ncbi:MAG TPA: hypothetical protein VH476_00230 [Solirubrobacterales bacterium]|jgi:membrane protein implicated in regulation of membrane protease activity
MSTEQSTEQPTTNLLDTVSDFLVGGGILTMALFPLAVPIVALLIVALLPLLAVAAVLAVIAAALIAPVVLIRRLSQWIATMPSDRREGRLIRGNRPMMGAHR